MSQNKGVARLLVLGGGEIIGGLVVQPDGSLMHAVLYPATV
jgi:hypothetical protein